MAPRIHYPCVNEMILILFTNVSFWYPFQFIFQSINRDVHTQLMVKCSTNEFHLQQEWTINKKNNGATPFRSLELSLEKNVSLQLNWVLTPSRRRTASCSAQKARTCPRRWARSGFSWPSSPSMRRTTRRTGLLEGLKDILLAHLCLMLVWRPVLTGEAQSGKW